MKVKSVGYTASQVIKMLHLQIAHNTLLKAEESGRIAKAVKNKDNKYRYWPKNAIPSIGKTFGIVKPNKSCVVIAVYMSKGGVGKTTLSYNLARFLALHGLKVLAIGTDFQCSLSKFFGVTKKIQPHSLFDLLGAENVSHIRDLVRDSDLENLKFIPENRELNFLDLALLSKMNREHLLSTHLKQIKNDFNAIIIDCPPYWSQVVTNALMASDYIVAPMNADDDSYSAFENFLEVVKIFKKSMEKNWRGIKFIPNIIDIQTNIESDYYDLLLEKYGNYFTKTKIRRAISVKEASACNESILEYAPNSMVADDLFNCLYEIWNDILRDEDSLLKKAQEKERSVKENSL